jgi:DNA polymerase-3 subunit gamma/tau
MSDYEKDYRPTELSEVIGQDPIVKSLQNYVKKDKLPHAFLFTGPSGVGKTTIARILKTILKAELIEIDAASYSGADPMRDASNAMVYKGIGNANKILLVDECQSLSKQAWQVLLKPIEDAKSHAYYILCTTEKQKVPKTIKTRCTEYDFKQANTDDLIDLLESVADDEDLEIDEEFIKIIAKSSDGSFRKALVSLSMCESVKNKKDLREILNTIDVGDASVIDVCRSLLSGSLKMDFYIKELKKLKDNNVMPETIRLTVISYLQSVILNKGKYDPRLFKILDAFTNNSILEPITGYALLLIAIEFSVID